MTIGKAIKQVRKLKKMKQAELAQKVELSQAYLSQIESGSKTPNLEVVERICQGLGIPLAVLHWMTLEPEMIAEHKREAFEFIRPIIDRFFQYFFIND